MMCKYDSRCIPTSVSILKPFLIWTEKPCPAFQQTFLQALCELLGHRPRRQATQRLQQALGKDP